MKLQYTFKILQCVDYNKVDVHCYYSALQVHYTILSVEYGVYNIFCLFSYRDTERKCVKIISNSNHRWKCIFKSDTGFKV